MITAYSLAATPLESQVGATVLLGVIGWVALASLALGLVAIVVLVARERLERRHDRVTQAPLPRRAAARAGTAVPNVEMLYAATRRDR
jgi:hypothetical protein